MGESDVNEFVRNEFDGNFKEYNAYLMDAQGESGTGERFEGGRFVAEPESAYEKFKRNIEMVIYQYFTH